MDVIEWLGERDSGFARLSHSDRDSIMQFSLLWSFFEYRVFGGHASSGRILTKAHEWDSVGVLDPAKFAGSFSYFLDRYVAYGRTTDLFKGLNLRRNDLPDLVKRVLVGENKNATDGVAVLLIIVYRLRNNLFHGTKWTGGIVGQTHNFTGAIDAMKTACDTHDRYTKATRSH